jgi:hypothetical protein
MKIKDGLKKVLVLSCGIIILASTLYVSQTKVVSSITSEESVAIVDEQNEVSEKYERDIEYISSRSGIREEVDTTEDSISSEIINATKENAPTAITIPMEQYIELSQVSISMGMNLTTRTGLSKEDFKTLMAGCRADTTKWFYNNSDLIYDLCKKYSINEVFFCGLISAESGWNIASNHRSTNNYTSLMSGGKLIHYGSLEQGLDASAKVLHDKYLTPGGSFYHGATISGVARCYCPESSWPGLVFGRMKQIVK